MYWAIRYVYVSMWKIGLIYTKTICMIYLYNIGSAFLLQMNYQGNQTCFGGVLKHELLFNYHAGISDTANQSNADPPFPEYNSISMNL